MRCGNCYVTCEALYHLLGGGAAGYTPRTVHHEGSVHWYLVKRTLAGFDYDHDGSSRQRWCDIILDPTAAQFKTPPPYHLGRGRGFLTKAPSKRARALMQQLVWQE